MAHSSKSAYLAAASGMSRAAKTHRNRVSLVRWVLKVRRDAGFAGRIDQHAGLLDRIDSEPVKVVNESGQCGRIYGGEAFLDGVSNDVRAAANLRFRANRKRRQRTDWLAVADEGRVIPAGRQGLIGERVGFE